MKKFKLLIFSCIMGLGLAAQDFFPYPTPPESMPVGRARANYMVEHFWDKCPWKSAFSSHQRMQKAFYDYADMLPVAQRDTVFASIDGLIKNVKKQPKDLLTLTRMAEAAFYSDTAVVPSHEVYLPFAKAAADCKKLSDEDRSYYSKQIGIINASSIGCDMPAVKILRDAVGRTTMLNDTSASTNEYLIIFEVPGSTDALFNRVRLSANAGLNYVVGTGNLHVIYLYPGTPDAAWWDDVKGMPQTWTVGALPQAEQLFDFRHQPVTVLADREMKIINKGIYLDDLIDACESIMQHMQQ
jgi:hypothetical protein